MQKSRLVINLGSTTIHTGQEGGGNGRLHCYHLCDPDHKECVKSSPIGKARYDTIPELIDEIEALEGERTKTA